MDQVARMRPKKEQAMPRRTQRARILRLLIDARGGWVALPEIMACAAQYNARVFELRHLGFNIENRTERVDGVQHSWFRLLNSPAQCAPEPVKEKTTPADSAASQLGDWYTQKTGKPRPGSTPAVEDGPLFSQAEGATR